MDFELSDDQLALEDAAAQLLDGLASPARVRSVFDSGDGFDPELWVAMIEQGWTGLTAPEAVGGLGLGIVELAVLLEQTGAHVAPAPFLQQSLVADALVGARDRGVEEVDAWLDPVVSGELLAAPAHIPVEARRTDGGWVIEGRPEPVVGGPGAGLVILRARTDEDGAERLFAVPIESDRIVAEPAMDRTRRLGWLDLDETPAVDLSGGLDGDEAVDRFVDLGALGHSAELLGASTRALAMTVDYAKEREQFGRPIGSFQAVKHRCSDMLVDVEGMRSAVYYAAWALSVAAPAASSVGAADGADDRGTGLAPDEASLAASTAKAWCSDAAKRVMASALQVHGGIGFTWEHDVHFYFKRAQLDQISFGDAAAHRKRIARLLRTRVEAGLSVF